MDCLRLALKLCQRRPSDWCCFQSGAPLWGPDLTPCSWWGVSSPQDGVDISYSWLCESSVCCLWLVLPPGVGCVCVCVCSCIFTPADHSPRGWRARWGAGGGEPPAVSRARSRHFLFPCSSLGMCAAPASSLPGPPLHPRKTRGLCLLVTHGRKLCRQWAVAVAGSASSAPPSGVTVLSRPMSETFVGWGLSPVLVAFSRWKQMSCWEVLEVRPYCWLGEKRHN